MSLEICPKCGNKSLIKTPHGRKHRESLGIMLHVSDTHSMDCLDKKCNYTSGDIEVKNNLGKKMELPWWKRLF